MTIERVSASRPPALPRKDFASRGTELPIKSRQKYRQGLVGYSKPGSTKDLLRVYLESDWVHDEYGSWKNGGFENADAVLMAIE